MADFFGANQNINIQDEFYYSQYALPFKWFRDYVSWSWLQDDLTVFGWNGEAYSGSWPDHQTFYQNLHSYGINPLMCVQGGNENGALNTRTNWWPYDTDHGSGYDVASYMDRTSFFGQASARFGRKGNHPSHRILSADKYQGLDLCRYIEDYNEQDLGWPGVWPDNSYAYHFSAVHDGAGLATNASRPLMGIKGGDSQMIHVMGGMAGANTNHLRIVRNTIGASRFSTCIEVINYHHYCMIKEKNPSPDGNPYDGTVNAGWVAGGVSPEHTTQGLRKVTQPLINWRNANAPGVPIWCTEFGWDTYTTGTRHADTFARSTYNMPRLAQANYLLRSFAILKGIGIEKAFMFMYRDPTSDTTGRFSTCGVTLSSGSPPTRKPSYHFITLMQNIIGPLYFYQEEKYAVESPWTYSYVFKNNADTRKVYMLWVTAINPLYDNGTTRNNYLLSVPYMTVATQITPLTNSSAGSRTALTVSNAGTSIASVRVPLLSETPRFISCHGSYAIPVIPSAFAAAAIATNKIRLSWTDLPNETSYTLYRNTSSSTSVGLTKIGGVSQDETTFTNANLGKGLTYYYWIRSFNAQGKSGFSTPSTATTWIVSAPPAIPTGLAATAIATNRIALNWNLQSLTSSFTLFRSLTASTSSPMKLGGVLSNRNVFTNSGLPADTTFYYYLRAYNQAGKSGYSAVASDKTFRSPPPSPGSFSGLSTTTNSASLSWGSTLRANGFKLFRNSVNSFGTATVIMRGFVLGFTDTGLQKNTTYYYWIVATNESGSSAASGPASVQTLLSTSPPSVPTLLTATGLTTNSVLLTWGPTPNVTTYTLFSSLTSSSNTRTRLAGFPSSEHAFTNTMLTPLTTYFYWIRAYNSFGVSPLSGPAQATTLDPKSFILYEDLDDVKAFPNPVSFIAGETFKISGIPIDAKLQIFSVNGTIIRSMEEDDIQFGQFRWDGLNDDGGLVANGVYIYKVSQKNKIKTGKIVVR